MLSLYEFSKIGGKSKQKRLTIERDLGELLDREYFEVNCLRLVKRLKRHRFELFTFCERKDLSSNNNFAERMIRPGVVIRKNVFGNQSEVGAQTFATFISFFQTNQLRQENYFFFENQYPLVVQSAEQVIVVSPALESQVPLPHKLHESVAET